MMYINHLYLDQEKYGEYNPVSEEIVKFSKLNIIIGKNNSGKSRLMRQILINEYNNRYLITHNITLIGELKKLLEKAFSYLNDYGKEMYKRTYLSKNILNNRLIRSEQEEEALGYFICNLLYNHKHAEIYMKLQSKRIIKSQYGFTFDDKFRIDNYPNAYKNRIHDLYCEITDDIDEVIPKSIYFPPLLSLRKIQNSDDSSLAFYNKNISKMFYSNYFTPIKDFNNYIKTGQEVYDDMKSQLLGLSGDRKKFLEYEEYIGNTFFGGKKISIFVKEADDNIYIMEDEEEEYPIYNLGDGLQTLIIITYYLFNSDVPMKVFIEEPEIHLHSELQRLLIENLLKHDNCQIFITTHSSDMIDICDEYDNDMSILCVEKKDGIKYVYNSSYDDMDLYKLIGTRPSSLILSNCVIWVEGPTDVKYIDNLLKLYIKIHNLKEYKLGYNYNYAFNGSINIASKFDFNNGESSSVKLNKLTKNNYFIFDSDNLNSENNNYQKIKKMKELFPDSCSCVDSVKTIENIIHPSIIKEYYQLNYEPKIKINKKIMIKYFDDLIDIYPNKEYFKKDFVKELNDLSNDDNYFYNLWKSNKSNLAIFYENEINKMSIQEKSDYFNSLPNSFKSMIKNIYKFIEINNK